MATITLTSTTESGFIETDFDQIKDLVEGQDTGDLAQVSTNTTAIATKLTSDGSTKITVGTTEPTSPATGDLWVDTN